MHIRTKNCIKRTFGVWKRRFPVLAYSLRFKLNVTLAIIVATALLHKVTRNIDQDFKLTLPNDIDEHELEVLIKLGPIPRVHNNNKNNGRINVGDNFGNNYFVNLYYATIFLS